MKTIVIAAWLVYGFAADAVAQTPLLYASAPEAIAGAMRDAGYRASVERDGAGDPVIRSGVSGSNFAIDFYGCENGSQCSSIQLSAAWKLDATVSLNKLNAWNRDQRFGKAYRDEEGDPVLELNVTMKGGLSRENFLDVLDWWGIAIGDFKKHIGW